MGKGGFSINYCLTCGSSVSACASQERSFVQNGQGGGQLHESRNPLGTKRSLQWDLRMHQKPLSWAWVGDTGKSVKRWGLGLRLATPMRGGARLRSAGG